MKAQRKKSKMMAQKFILLSRTVCNASSIPISDIPSFTVHKNVLYIRRRLHISLRLNFRKRLATYMTLQYDMIVILHFHMCLFVPVVLQLPRDWSQEGGLPAAGAGAGERQEKT